MIHIFQRVVTEVKVTKNWLGSQREFCNVNSDSYAVEIENWE